ncbi:uncharacterized protein MYCFIDRAFT_77043, partial [Pseudocercospora fijiensis CIRAD86]
IVAFCGSKGSFHQSTSVPPAELNLQKRFSSRTVMITALTSYGPLFNERIGNVTPMRFTSLPKAFCRSREPLVCRNQVEYPYYHESRQSLADSTALGCFVCASVTRSTLLGRNPFAGSTNFGSYSSTSHYIRILSAPDRSHERGDVCGSVQVHELGEEIATLSASALCSPSTGSQATLSVAQYWLGECMKTHAKCGAGSDPQWYPTRLLDLSQSRIRLIETTGKTLNGRYATLSHCWGGETIPVMNSENHDTFVSIGRALSEFPKSHAEAIEAARTLGFRYFWIDCYCIMQAGMNASFTSDKAKELTMMKLVCANSALNIGATSASAPSIGCFTDHNGSIVCPDRITLTRPGLARPQVFQVDSFDYVIDKDMFYRKNKLFTRGWVFQERLLAPRMLHFAGEQLYWECSDVPLASDRLPFNIQERANPEFPFNLDRNDVQISKYNAGVWENVVMAYSRLELSYPLEDKFAALSGVAERMTELLDEQYIAGLFKSRLPQQLCWYREPGSSRDKRWRAPSWSWACMDGRVGFSGGLEEALAEYVSSAVYPHHLGNDYGRLKDASITLSGRMLEGRIRRHPSRLRNAKRVLQEDLNLEVGSIEIQMNNALGVGFHGSSFDDDILLGSPSGSTFYLLPLVWCDNSKWQLPHLTAEETLNTSQELLEQQSTLEMRGLVLETSKDEALKRCGQFHISGTEDPVKLLKMWASISPAHVPII